MHHSSRSDRQVRLSILYEGREVGNLSLSLRKHTVNGIRFPPSNLDGALYDYPILLRELKS